MAAGSVLIATGRTKVIVTASVDESVPPFLKGQGRGWVTAEYAMLPASTGRRKARDGIKKDGNVQLIGFGTFAVKARAARTGRNPQTGATIKIKASKTVGFKAGAALKETAAKTKKK